MLTMPLQPTREDIALRLILTLIASAVIGLNRETGGHSAGFRTTILVGLAASVAMIQANILLDVGGKAADSFGTMDLMRLPLGILTGVGFIGGGAILKRGHLVAGVTTAATLWATTVVGLCFGGGQLGLGCAATVLIVATLWVLKWLDDRIPRKRRGRVVIAIPADAVVPEMDALIRPSGFGARFLRQDKDGAHKRAEFEVHWKRPKTSGPPFELLQMLEQAYDVRSFALLREGTN
jgi:putative Mg2+ transporter-C (MgtC) family protein